ncbi:MAG: glucose-1-phosphate thymidylyltransferase, partial [Bacteroidetes bacterium]
MNIIFYDSPNAFLSLQPFTLTRPICEIRIGILKIREKWVKALEKSLNIAEVGYQTMPYLQAKYPLPYHQENAQYLFINSCFLPHQDWLPEINHLLLGEGILYQDMPIAWRSSHTENSLEYIKQWKNIGQDPTYLQNTWDIFLYNAQEIQQDFTSITHGRSSASISDPHTICYNKENIFIEEGAKIKAAILNAEKGVIYIGKNTEIQELSVIHGNFALCEGAVLNMGTKIKGDTTIGEYSKVGGEISNSVIFGYSNKGHEGFLGNSVIGEWCN